MIELAHLANLKQSSNGRLWLSQLPESFERICAQWQIEANAKPYLDSTVSFVLPALQNGVPVVLKLQWSHEECQYEADALRQWDGFGMVRLLTHNPNEHAMLHFAGPCVTGGRPSMFDVVDWSIKGEPT